ncbi:class I SAM-dependent methyltransferase [Acidobacteria bacterium AB60]|nr:class I SAM-dependent methyltransferase [Acidobacteria bacterium AB60]
MQTLSPRRQWFGDRTFAGAVRAFLRDLRRSSAAARPDPEIHPFDREHHVDTSGLFYADKLRTGHPHDTASEGYYATAPSLFHRALARWQQTLGASPALGPRPSALSNYTLIDLGSGKGRVVMMAAGYPFRKVTGIELSPKLARIARSNLATWLSTPRACSNVTLQVGDVMQLRLPDGPVLLFLFNSFGAEVMTRLLEGLAAAARRRTTPIDLICVHPEHDALVRGAGFQLLADEEIAFTPEDAASDAFQVTHDRCTLYRLPPGA